MDYPIDEDMEHEAGYPEGAVLQNPLYTTLPPPAKTRTRTQEQLASLFETPEADDNDIYTADLFETPDDEDVDDLLTVKRSDITGYLQDDEPRRPREPHWSDEDIARRQRQPRGAFSYKRLPVIRRILRPKDPDLGGMR